MHDQIKTTARFRALVGNSDRDNLCPIWFNDRWGTPHTGLFPIEEMDYGRARDENGKWVKLAVLNVTILGTFPWNPWDGYKIEIITKRGLIHTPFNHAVKRIEIDALADDVFCPQLLTQLLEI